MAAITWRNVDGPSSRDSAATIAAGSMLANNIQQGLSGIGDVFTQLRDKKISDNNNIYLNALDRYTTPDQLQQAIQSGEVSNMLQAFKGNLDPSMRSAADTRLKAMIEAQRGTDTHNLKLNQGQSSLESARLNQENQRINNQYLPGSLENRNAIQESQATISQINADNAVENAELERARNEINFNTFKKAEDQKKLHQEVSNRVGSAFPNLVDPETGLFDINVYQGLNPIMKAGVDKLISPEEVRALSSGDTELFQSSANELVNQEKIPERIAARLIQTPGAGLPTAAPLQGEDAKNEQVLSNIYQSQLKEQEDSNYMFWGPPNPGDWSKFARDNLLTRYDNDPTDNRFKRANDFINRWKDHQIEMPNGEKTRVPLGILMDAVTKADNESWVWTSASDMDDALTKLLKSNVTRERIYDSIGLRDKIRSQEALRNLTNPDKK